MPASEDLNGDDPNGFTDIDELLSGVQQKGRTSVDPDYSGIAVDMVDNRTRGGSYTSSSRSTVGSNRGEHTASPSSARTSLTQCQIRLYSVMTNL